MICCNNLLKVIGDAGHGNYTLFEECLFRNGFAPVISIPTHERQNCKPSCINNILSGCITIRIGDHAPTFEFTDIEFQVGPKMKK